MLYQFSKKKVQLLHSTVFWMKTAIFFVFFYSFAFFFSSSVDLLNEELMECTHTAVHTLLSFHNLLRHYVSSNAQKHVFILNSTNILETRRNGVRAMAEFSSTTASIYMVCVASNNYYPTAFYTFHLESMF